MIAIEGLQKRYNTNTELARDSVTFIFVHHAIRTIKGNLTELRFNRTCKCNKINVSMSLSKIFLKNVAFFMFVCVFFFSAVRISCSPRAFDVSKRNAPPTSVFKYATQRRLIRFGGIQVFGTPVCIILRGSGSPNGEILVPCLDPSVAQIRC